MNGFPVCLLFPQEMASNKIPESPTKKRKLDILQESMQSGSDELDVLLTSSLYYVSKGDTSQCTNILEKSNFKDALKHNRLHILSSSNKWD